MTLIHNERTKLTAPYLNGVAIALFAVGAIAPVVSVLNGATGSGLGVALMAVVCIAVTAVLHFLARIFLGRLRP